MIGLYIDFFFFNDTATTEIYTLSLHDALPIWSAAASELTTNRSARPITSRAMRGRSASVTSSPYMALRAASTRSEEHTSELQSHSDLVCRLLLEKKKTQPLPRLHRQTRQNWTA